MLWPQWLLLLVGVLSLLTDTLETDHLVSAMVWDRIQAISHNLLFTVNTVIYCYATSFLDYARLQLIYSWTFHIWDFLYYCAQFMWVEMINNCLLIVEMEKSHWWSCRCNCHTLVALSCHYSPSLVLLWYFTYIHDVLTEKEFTDTELTSALE